VPRTARPACAACAFAVLFFAAHLAAGAAPAAYLGFDTNNYPGDAALPILKETFSFAGYWLNEPPGGASTPWTGKRAILRRNGFGFLVLFNGRLEHELKTASHAAMLGSSDARLAAKVAAREGFRASTVIFLDQEEGGEMEPDQMAYLLAWTDGVAAAGFRPGVYCSGIPVGSREVVTARDIHERAGKRSIAFFVYDDACPPSPGCAYEKKPRPPTASGVPFASVWQFAQSPRRREFTAPCGATYDGDGNCYAPGTKAAHSIFLDLDSATSADPSNGR
jgi:Domain of unknown function (DUF1906)